ncbi:MAG: glycoside hydrolase family 16 protein [Candidatus Krumholzibacteria bacterium]|nr:glycoside hydrolase family 16 protein [Candidatus Krumholzibacteria bacterium]MDH4335663.1 glycoside hydrolase family 16 protein [Candidatus Krumholzibacteria bacterium]MDH5270442.1 glycoside hydrolase family 16 protein [Candidatus Krumholzibacteria bacterium]
MRHRRILKLLSLSVLVLTSLGFNCDREDALQWSLVWQDEFDGPEGQSPNPQKWRFDIGTDWGNRQLEYDTDRPENVSLDGNGRLRIIAREEAYEGSAYTSGRINTRQLFAHEHGRFEAKVLLPIGQGIWPAFWMLGADFPEVPWPDCGEIDIMEYRGQEPNILVGTIHGPGHFGDAAISGRYQSSGYLNEQYHVYAIEWDGGSITWFIDAIQYHRVTRDDLPEGARWVYNHPFFMLLNVAVGGRWAGPPDATTVFPQTMLVDWVRVYAISPRD